MDSIEYYRRLVKTSTKRCYDVSVTEKVVPRSHIDAHGTNLHYPHFVPQPSSEQVHNYDITVHSSDHRAPSQVKVADPLDIYFAVFIISRINISFKSAEFGGRIQYFIVSRKDNVFWAHFIWEGGYPYISEKHLRTPITPLPLPLPLPFGDADGIQYSLQSTYRLTMMDWFRLVHHQSIENRRLYSSDNVMHICHSL